MFGPDFLGRDAGRPRLLCTRTGRELIQAPQWPDDHLPELAPRVRVPVRNALAEFDAMWDSSPANVEQFAMLLTAVPYVDASVARATGHSIDHHILGYALHLRQPRQVRR